MTVIFRRQSHSSWWSFTSSFPFRASLIGLALILAGCTTIPAAIQGTSPTPFNRLTQIQLMPQNAMGQEARLGGRVVDVRNEDHRTRLEIVSLPLDRWARPQLAQISDGRFVAYVPGFLEPLDFRGRLVTVVGPISGMEAGRIGAKPYNFVVIDTTGYQRWNETQQVMFPPGPVDPWDWRYRRGRGFANDWPAPARIETIVTP